MIKIYPSPSNLPTKHDAIYETPVHPGETLLEAVVRLVPSYDPSKPTPFTCEVNGAPVVPSRFAAVVLGAETSVAFYLTPRGDVINKVLNVFTLGAWNLVMKFLTPKIANLGGTGGQQRERDDMDLAAAKANTVKQGAVIREKFGEGRVYPDHLVQLRRFFLAGDPTKQASEMFLSMGRGRFMFDFTKSKVGETLQSALGDNLVVRTYDPGASLTLEPIADNWFTSSEVGGTAGGTAGLDLTTTTTLMLNSEATTYVLSGDAVTIPLGAGTWPEGWDINMTLRALTPYPWTVTDGGVGVRDQVSGPWDSIGPFVGMQLEAAGDFNGRFVVASVVMSGPSVAYVTLDYPDTSPVTELPLGTFTFTVGYTGLRYRIDSIAPQVMTLIRLTDTGAEDLAWPGFAPVTTSAARFTLQTTNTEGGWRGPYVACPDGELTTEIELDFFYPSGLYSSNSDGNPEELTVEVEAQYRDRAIGGAWTSVSFSHTSDKMAQVGFSPRITVPYAMQPEVRTRRITIDSLEGTKSDQVQWYGLKSRLENRPNSYPDMTTVAVRVFGGGALAAQAEQMVSFWVTRILPYRSGGAWQPEAPTRSIAAAAIYLAKDRGYADARLDLAEFDRLGAIWDARGDYFDGSFEKETTAEAALNVILRPGYAQIIAPRGILRPVRDALRSADEKAVARLYSPANSTDILRSGQPVSLNDTDGVDVKYLNPKSWTTETVKCRLPGVPNPNKVTTLNVEGVNDRTRAWRLGMRELMAARFRRWKNTWSTGLDSFSSSYMDYVEMADNVPNMASVGQLRYWNGAQLFEVNEPIRDGTVAALRRPDGTKFGPYPLTRVDDYSFTLAQPLDFTPVTETDPGRVPTHVFTGQIEQMFWPCLVSSVQPSGQYSANVEALGYDERVYQYDDAEPPADA